MSMLEAVVEAAVVAADLDQFLLLARLHGAPVRVDPLRDGRVRLAIAVDVS